MNVYQKFRDSAGWSQARLAQELGVSRAAVHNYERGRVPETEIAYRFMDLAAAHSFEVSLADVFPRPGKAANGQPVA